VLGSDSKDISAIMKLDEKRPTHVLPFDQMRTTISEQLKTIELEKDVSAVHEWADDEHGNRALMDPIEAERWLRAACARLPDEKRALLKTLNSADISDQVFTTAMVIVQMMRFDKDSLLRTYVISQVTGLATGSVGQSVDKLLELGVLARQTCRRSCRRMSLYRLANPIASVAEIADCDPAAIRERTLP
jgi:hypothetical protein